MFALRWVYVNSKFGVPICDICGIIDKGNKAVTGEKYASVKCHFKTNPSSVPAHKYYLRLNSEVASCFLRTFTIEEFGLSKISLQFCRRDTRGFCNRTIFQDFSLQTFPVRIATGKQRKSQKHIYVQNPRLLDTQSA